MPFFQSLKQRLLLRAIRPALVIFIFAGACESRAAITITANEVGSSVLFQYSGVINLAGTLVNFADQTQGSAVNPTTSYLQFAPVGQNFPYIYYDFFTGNFPASFGTGALSQVSNGTGDIFAIGKGLIIVPSGYVSGNPLAGSATYASSSFSSLGITPGNYTWGLSSDTVTLNVVPEPGVPALLISALGLFWYRPTRR